MKKTLISFMAALCCTVSLFAVPARRGTFTHTQPDGTQLVLQRHGDEFLHWVTDASGQVMEKDPDGYYRPTDAQTHARRMAAAQLRRTDANRLRRRTANKAGVASGQKHFLVILVEFSDLSFKNGNNKNAFSNMLNQEGYSANGATGSARDYYYDNSHGDFEPIFDVYGPVKLENKKEYYGGNDSSGYDLRPEDAVKEGCEALDDEIDFSQYDNDGDGEVDLVFMYYAGYGEADYDDDDAIWPHQWDFTSAGINLTLDGKKINNYACTNELVGYGSQSGKLAGIGTACHEFGHAMGLPDLYDTDYKTNGEAGGLYAYSLMCDGGYNNEGRTPPYFNIEERIMLGWLEDSAIQEFPESGEYILAGVNDDVAYKTLTDQEGEYFVYECRNQTGWDAYIPEAGMVVYHVDKSDRKIYISGYGNVSAKELWEDWPSHNAINERGSHPCFYLVPAGSQSNLNYSGSQWTFPGSANATSFTAQSWNGVESVVKITNISYSASKVTLMVEIPAAALSYNIISNPGNGVYAAGTVFDLALVESTSQPVSSVSWLFDDEPVSGSVTLPAGTHVVEAHVTLTSGVTKILELTLQVE